MAYYAQSIEGLACKVTELHDVRATLRVVFLCFSTNIDYCYVYVNWTGFLEFLHHHSFTYLNVFMVYNFFTSVKFLILNSIYISFPTM